MLRATRMLLAPGVVKRTTGIVGLDVVPNAREVLIKLYEKTLNDIKVCVHQCMRRMRCRQRRPTTGGSVHEHSRALRSRNLQIIPETAEYRKVVEKFTNYRLDVVKKTDDVSGA